MPETRSPEQFGLVYRVPDDQQAIYRRAFVNLPFANGDDSWELPIPATFILDRDGTILYASADEDYTQRPEPQEILQQLSTRPVRAIRARFNYDWIWVSPHFGTLTTSAAGSTS